MLSPQARIALKVVWAVFLLTCLCLRFWINRHRFRTKWWITGDVCVTGAFALLVPTSGMLIYENVKYLEWYGSDQENILLHPLLQANIRQIHFAMIYLYLCGMWLLKGAFIALYFDLFARQEGRKYRWLLYSLAVWTAIAFFVLIFLCTFICTPVSQNWAIIPQCNILTSKATLYTNYTLNCATDFFIFALPLFIVHSLKLDMRQKFGFALVILIGLVSICASTARFVEMFQFRQAYASGSFRTLDQFGEMLLSIEDWSLAECWTALLAFCLPSFKVFLRRRRHSGMRMTSSQRVTVTQESHKFGTSWRTPSLDATELGNFTEIRSVAATSDGDISQHPSLSNMSPNVIIAQQDFECSLEPRAL